VDDAGRATAGGGLGGPHAASTTGEAPPFQLGIYDPANKSGSTPETFATFLAAESANADPKLTDDEKLRFTIAPETIAAADSMAAVAIQKSIEDVDFARALVRRHNRSGRNILRSEHDLSKKELSDGAGAFLHKTADLIIRAGPAAISVAAYNRMAGQYLRICRSVPNHLRRGDAVLADALAASVKRLSPDVSNSLEIKLELRSAKSNIWRTEREIRATLSEHQLTDAHDSDIPGTGLFGGHDPKKGNAYSGPPTVWKPELGNCRYEDVALGVTYRYNLSHVETSLNSVSLVV
jgi:hypothetical protein